MIGCGGDDDEETTPAATVPTQTVRPPVTTPPPETTPTGKKPESDPDAEPRTVPAPEAEGDEEPIRSEAVFTGQGGRLRPRVVQVPAFIAVRVILRSTDDRPYTLIIGGQRLEMRPGHRTSEAELPGLLPNKAYLGASPQGNVRIVASAEPGP